MNRSPWSSVKSQFHEQRVGVTPRPSLVPAGAPRPWEGSVKGGGGRSPAFSFPAWVARTRCLRQEAQRYPCAGHPASTVRASTGVGASAAPGRGGTARHSDGDERGCAR